MLKYITEDKDLGKMDGDQMQFPGYYIVWVYVNQFQHDFYCLWLAI